MLNSSFFLLLIIENCCKIVFYKISLDDFGIFEQQKQKIKNIKL